MSSKCSLPERTQVTQEPEPPSIAARRARSQLPCRGLPKGLGPPESICSQGLRDVELRDRIQSESEPLLMSRIAILERLRGWHAAWLDGALYLCDVADSSSNRPIGGDRHCVIDCPTKA